MAYSFLHQECLSRSIGQKTALPGKSLGQALTQLGRCVSQLPAAIGMYQIAATFLAVCVAVRGHTC